MGRPVRGVPMVIGAPSHTHGLSFTRKLQPMSAKSPRTFLSGAVVAAVRPREREERPGEGGGGGGGGRNFAGSVQHQGGRSPDPTATSSSSPRVVSMVPSDSVHPQSGGRSCCAVVSTGAVLVQLQLLDSGRCPCCAGH